MDLADLRPERDPESAASAADERGRLVRALGELPDGLRVVVVLRDVYDLPHREIARELGISQSAAKVRLHRARRLLRERIFPVRRSGVVASGDVERPAGRGGKLAPVTMRLIPASVENDAMRASWMAEVGCDNQANALLKMASK